MKPSGIELKDARILGYALGLREAYDDLYRLYASIPRCSSIARNRFQPLLEALRAKIDDAERGKL